MVKASLLAASFLSTCLTGQPTLSPEGEFLLHADSQLVILNVGVQDGHGKNIKGLQQNAFKILEDGRPQPVKQFAGEDRPVSVGIVVDTSGSMQAKQAEVVAAALAFVGSSNPEDETFVVNFNDHASLGLPPHVPFSQNPVQLRAALVARKPEGKTALYDALTLAANHLAQAKWESKVLLLISDGGDNNSSHTWQQALKAVELSGAAVYSVGLYDPEEPEHNLGTLRRLSQISGGEVLVPGPSEIGAICRRIAEDIRAGYTLAYTPPPSPRLAVLRKIKVLASASDGTKFNVRTRAGYVLQDH